MKVIFNTKSRKEIKRLESEIDKLINELVDKKEKNKKCLEDVLQLRKENAILKEEKEKLEKKVEKLEKTIKNINQENNLSSIYDEYLYGPKEKEGE